MSPQSLLYTPTELLQHDVPHVQTEPALWHTLALVAAAVCLAVFVGCCRGSAGLTWRLSPGDAGPPD